VSDEGWCSENESRGEIVPNRTSIIFGMNDIDSLQLLAQRLPGSEEERYKVGGVEEV